MIGGASPNVSRPVNVVLQPGKRRPGGPPAENLCMKKKHIDFYYMDENYILIIFERAKKYSFCPYSIQDTVNCILFCALFVRVILMVFTLQRGVST